LDKKRSWLKQFLASDWSISLLVASSMLLLSGLLISLLATGSFTLPAIVFTAGSVAAISSACIIAAAVAGTGFFGLFLGFTAMYVWDDPQKDNVMAKENLPRPLAVFPSSRTKKSEDDNRPIPKSGHSFFDSRTKGTKRLDPQSPNLGLNMQ
jgi:hypothetical protein